MISITPELRQEVERAGGEPVRIEDTETKTAYLVIREDVYLELFELAAYDHSDRSLYEYEDFRPIHENP